MSSDENGFDELYADNVLEVAKTSRLFRLVPSVPNLARRTRPIAIVPANTEAHARALASQHDPFGVDWKDELAFRCDLLETELEYTVGDVLFTAKPALPSHMRRAPKTRKKKNKSS